MAHSRRHEAAARAEMRRWLRARGIEPAIGQERSHTEGLMRQVLKAGGNPHQLTKEACLKIEAARRAAK